VAIVTYISGEAVKVLDQTEEAIHHGDILYSDVTIKIKENAILDLTFSDKSIVRLKEKATLKLSLMAETKKGGHIHRLDLSKGKILNMVSKIKEDGDYTVTAPTAIAGVRGTVFEVIADEETTVFVAEGNVQVDSLIGKKEKHSLLEKRGVTIRDEKDYLFGDPERAAALLLEAEEMKGNKKKISEETLKLTNQLADVKIEAELSKIFNKDIELIELSDGRTLRGVIVSMLKEKCWSRQ